MKEKIHRAMRVFSCILFCSILLSGRAIAKEEEMEVSSLTISDGEQDYGMLYGAPYSESDDSQWLTLKLEGRGLRVVNETGNDIVLIDRFGAIYINGKLINQDLSATDSSKDNNFSYGFMYFLVIVSLVLGGYNFIARKKR